MNNENLEETATRYSLDNFHYSCPCCGAVNTKNQCRLCQEPVWTISRDDFKAGAAFREKQILELLESDNAAFVDADRDGMSPYWWASWVKEQLK